MTIKEFYTKINGDYDEVLSRLGKEERVQRFAKRFFDISDEDDIGDLTKAIENQDANNIFEYAHRIKGNSLNIGYSEIAKYAEILVEEIRPRKINNIETINEMFKNLKTAYDKTKEYAVLID